MSQTILSSSCILRLEISAWTGKAKLTRADLPSDVELPPEDLAVLGTKRLIDPVSLRPFNKCKTQAVRVLEQYAVRFLGGWLMDRKCLDAVEQALLPIKQEFDRELTAFARDYEINVDNWCQQYPQWEYIIRAALPSAENVAKRFKMAWQVITIQPYASDTGVSAGNDTAELIDNVATQVVEDLAQNVKDLYDIVLDGRTKGLSSRTMNPVRALSDKCRNVSLFNPEAVFVGNILSSLATMDPKDPATQTIMEATLSRLSDPSSLQQMVDDWKVKGQEVFAAFAPAPAPVEQPAPVAQPKPAAQPAPAPAPTQRAADAPKGGLASLLQGLF